MKRIISLLLAFVCIFTFAACGGNEEDDGKALETADTVYNVEGNAGTVTLDEETAKALLGAFTPEILGLEQEIEFYDVKLSATRIFNSDACMVEVLEEGTDTVVGTYAIMGEQCFVYDSAKKEYLKLTVNGAVSVTQSGDESATGEGEDVTLSQISNPKEENNSRLHEIFSEYTKEQLHIEKELSEYDLVANGATSADDDGNTVYVVIVSEKDGTKSGYTLGFNSDSRYYYDIETGKYVKL